MLPMGSLIVIAYSAFLALEGFAITRIDRWLPVSSFVSATWYALFVTAVLTWLRLCLIGLGVRLLMISDCSTSRNGLVPFAILWGMGSAIVAGAILSADLLQHRLQYGAESYSDETVRVYLLLFVYMKILLVYLGVRWLLVAAMPLPPSGGAKGWTSIPFAESIKLYIFLLLLKLTVENVLVAALSYLPFVAPFWFIPDELSRLRYFVGQGTRIAAESIGAVFYIIFFAVFVRGRMVSGATVGAKGLMTCDAAQ